MPEMSEVTRILSAIKQGDPLAAELLLPLVYDELRQLAAERLAHEQPGQTLQATALVHEAYLRLLGGKQTQDWGGRRHFFAAAAGSTSTTSSRPWRRGTATAYSPWMRPSGSSKRRIRARPSWSSSGSSP